jgi:hypothetical protein
LRKVQVDLAIHTRLHSADATTRAASRVIGGRLVDRAPNGARTPYRGKVVRLLKPILRPSRAHPAGRSTCPHLAGNSTRGPRRAMSLSSLVVSVEN